MPPLGRTQPPITCGAWLHWQDIHGRAGILPLDAQRAALATLIEGDGKVFDRRRGRGSIHVRAYKILVRAGIRDSPFAGFLADDERPFVFIGNGKNRVFSSWHVLATI